MNFYIKSAVTGFVLFIGCFFVGSVSSNDQPELLKQIPKKIVALNWTQAEMLLTLGVVPAGVTSIKGYKKWQSNTPSLPDGVQELGLRTEPSLETIAKLQPDLILGYSWRHRRIEQELQAIAPTLLFRQYLSGDDTANYFQRMQRVFRSLAQLLNKESLADAELERMRQSIAQARDQISASGLSGQPVVVGKFVGMGLGLRVYADASLAGALVNELGLKNSWHSALPGRDFTHVDLLKLTTIDEASLIIVGSQPEALPAMTTSPVWQSLPAVKEGRVFYLPSLWSFGGPVSASRMAEAIASHLTSEAE